jgi:hypothetical protein
MDATQKIYPIKIDGHNLKLRFITEDSPTKRGVKLQFVTDKFNDITDKQQIANKINVILQKKFSAANISINYNDREVYENVISYIVPIESISNMFINIIKS